MPIDIDGYAVLGAISRKPNVFPAIKNDVSKTARALIVKQLKEKTASLDSLRAIATAVEHEAFDLIIDLMSDAEVKTLIGKLDKLNTEIKTAEPQWHRKRISDLAKSTADPIIKVPVAKAPKVQKLAKPAVERAVNSRAVKAKKKV